MQFSIGSTNKNSAKLYIVDTLESLLSFKFSVSEIQILEKSYKKDTALFSLNQNSVPTYIYLIKEVKTTAQTAEKLRKTGAELQGLLQKTVFANLHIDSASVFQNSAFFIAQGLALANYQFLKYRKNTKELGFLLQSISFAKNTITTQLLKELKIQTEAAYLVRNLVNEPLNFLTATQLAKEIQNAGKVAGFKTTILDKKKIEKEKMGGLLAVNKGSIDPPTFTIMEFKSPQNKLKNPIVLIGKGIVYDTGGLSLKPTPASMDRMKSDMSGAALVTGVMYAVAQMNLPLHLIAIVPATDNRPGGNAYVPGDIITQYDGTSVEVLNTDAEGRLVLADALHWAKRYQPELVLDFATLTGAAAAAIGDLGIVCMGTASEEIKTKIQTSGENQYERLVEFPLWDEYRELIKSDIADLKNVGGPTGGAITAGKFLQHFTDYSWMHFDIAGVSFTTSKKNYYSSGGTAFGMRMVIDFLKNYNTNSNQ